MRLEAGGHWRNWVGNQSFVARHKGAPASEDELCAMVATATRQGLNVSCAGSGHSFTPVVATSGLLLSLEGLVGLQTIDHARRRVTIAAGTRIRDVGQALKAEGLSLVNQGDIDSQALAGALLTGTHGTGQTLGNLASKVVGMRLVQPDGSILEVDDTRDAEMVRAAQVSLGLLGVVSSITLDVMPRYNLHERVWRDDFDACMEQHDDLAAAHRHFAFFWCPTQASRHLYCLEDTAAVSRTSKVADVCEMKVMDITEAEPDSGSKPFERIAYSSDIYPIEYVPNFHELEYAVPLASGKEALREVRGLMLDRHPTCIYPVEYRFTAGDPGWISPFHRQDSVTISVSGGPGRDDWAYLADVDAILRRHGARPHWGKLHFLDRDDVTTLYPQAEAFRTLRQRLDPQGFFLNDHFRQLFV